MIYHKGQGLIGYIIFCLMDSNIRAENWFNQKFYDHDGVEC